MFPISLILPEIPSIKIVDVGAMDVGPESDAYHDLPGAMTCQVVGFEPVVEECAKLNAQGLPNRVFLPYVIGDGSVQTFHQCAEAYNSSLLEPNMPLLEQFTDFAELFRVVATSPVQTKRLDDVGEASGAEFLKLDVQGGELMVLDGAPNTLRDVLVIHTEAEFVPLYKGQPLFGDLDARLRAAGFVLHRITFLANRPFKPLSAREGEIIVASQLLWGDVVYVRDFLAFERLTEGQLLKLAAILHENYTSYDLVCVVLRALDLKSGSDLEAQYLSYLAPK
jgi:FkbM family methyltransferase